MFRPAATLRNALLGIALSAVSAAPSQAQWTVNGFNLNNHFSKDFFTDGGTGVVSVGIYATRVDSAGVKVWGPTPTGQAFSQRPDAVASDATGYFSVFPGSASIFASKVSTSGVLAWSLSVRSSLPTGGFNADCCPDGAGGLIVVWCEKRSGNFDVFAQRLNASGAPQWTSTGVPICLAANDQTVPSAVADGSGGAFFVWQDARPLSGTEANIFAQRINSSGTIQWATDGVAICQATGEQLYPVMVADGTGGVFISWWDARGGDRDVYAQRVNGAGTAQWTTNGKLVGGGAFDQLLPTILPDGTGGAFVAWEDHRAGGATGLDIYAQRLDANGDRLWLSTGVPVCTAVDEQQRPQVASDGAGGVLVGWADGRDISYTDAAVQRLAGDGTAQWKPDGVVLRGSNVDLNNPISFCSDNAGGAYAGYLSMFRVTGAGIPMWCANYTGRLNSVTDVPADEGGLVRLNVTAPASDGGVLGPGTVGYNVWRLAPGAAVNARPRDRAALEQMLASQPSRPIVLDGPPLGFPPGTWESVGSHLATQSPTYLFLAPTRTDSSTAGSGTDTYVVTTHSSQNFYMVSAAVGGHSVDNLAPGAPQSLVGTVNGSTLHLAWGANTEADLTGYDVYRGTSPTFTPSPSNRLGVTPAPQFDDPDYGTGTWYYKVTARDRHDNESAATPLTPLVGVGDPGVPARSFLSAAAPNPVRDMTSIAYGLARPGRVSLDVFDLAGRHVRTLFVGDKAAGTWRVSWDGAGDRGQPLHAGVYLVRFSAPGTNATTRVVLSE